MRAASGSVLGIVAAFLIGAGVDRASAQATNPTVTFTNGTDVYVQQFHMMPNGSKNRHAEIAPGGISKLVSKPDQTWVFEVSGQQIGSYVTTSAPSQTYKVIGKVNPGDEAPKSVRK